MDSWRKLLLAGAAALLLTGAMADHASAEKGFSGGGGSFGGHASAGGGNFGGAKGFSGGYGGAPRAAVTTGTRGGTFTGRTGTFGGRTGTFSGRTGTFSGRTGAWGGRSGAWAGHGGRGHWVWRNHRRVFVPFGVGVGIGLGLGYYDNDCVAWNGWRYVNVCYGPYAGGYGPGWW